MQTLRISLALADRGHEITLLCRPDTILAQEAARNGLAVAPLLREDRHIWQGIWQTLRFLRQSRWDIIHCHLSHDLWTLVPALHLAGRATPLLMSKRMASGVRKCDPLHRYLYRRVNRILTVSGFIRENVLRTCPVPPEKVHVLLNGLPIDAYDPGKYNREEIRRELGLNASDVVVGMVARLTPKKGHREFLEAARRILDQTDVPVHFLVVGGASYGEEEYEQAIRALAASRQLFPHITFTGFRRDVPRMMAAMDILAFPSYGESFPNTLLEAMALQLPVVAAAGGAVPEVVVEGHTGLLVPPRDGQALAEKLLELIRDPRRREEMGRQGRRRVETHFRFDHYLEKLEGHYQEFVTSMGKNPVVLEM